MISKEFILRRGGAGGVSCGAGMGGRKFPRKWGGAGAGIGFRPKPAPLPSLQH